MKRGSDRKAALSLLHSISVLCSAKFFITRKTSFNESPLHMKFRVCFNLHRLKFLLQLRSSSRTYLHIFISIFHPTLTRVSVILRDSETSLTSVSVARYREVRVRKWQPTFPPIRPPPTIIVIAFRSFSVDRLRDLIRPGGAMHFRDGISRDLSRRRVAGKSSKKGYAFPSLSRKAHFFTGYKISYRVLGIKENKKKELKKIKKRKKEKRIEGKHDKKKNDRTRGGREEWKYRAKIVGNST